MTPEQFLRTYGFPALPMSTLFLGAPADEAEDKPEPARAADEVTNKGATREKPNS